METPYPKDFDTSVTVTMKLTNMIIIYNVRKNITKGQIFHESVSRTDQDIETTLYLLHTRKTSSLLSRSPWTLK